MKIYKYIILFLFSLCPVFLSSQEVFNFHNGDILFQIGKGNDFEEAIISVTSGIEDLDFSHVGVVYIEKDSAFVLEASPTTGVSKTRLKDFIDNSSFIAVGRLKDEYQYTIPDAILTISDLIGKPYDFVFHNNNDAYYCSELVQIAFKDDNNAPVFGTIKMTFKDKNSNETHPYWIEYYKRYNETIPEGEDGTNPSQLSKSEAIEIIHMIRN